MESGWEVDSTLPGRRMHPTIHTIDLKYLKISKIISVFAVPTGDDGFVLLETGPASTVRRLERGLHGEGLELERLRAIFLTHVHLDHSGAAGALARRVGCPVYVHPKGAHHLVDPSRLLASARRLYGPMMRPLWGTTESVPEELVRPVGSGDPVRVDGVEVFGWHTPGHASHHVAWQVGDAVVTGDVGGVRFPGCSHVVPPMPPPDIDVGRWRESIDLVRSLEPGRLLLTHFGGYDDPGRHLDELEDRVRRWSEIGESVRAAGGTVKDLARELGQLDSRELKASGADLFTTQRYRKLCPMGANAVGLFRSIAKRS